MKINVKTAKKNLEKSTRYERTNVYSYNVCNYLFLRKRFLNNENDKVLKQKIELKFCRYNAFLTRVKFVLISEIFNIHECKHRTLLVG